MGNIILKVTNFDKAYRVENKIFFLLGFFISFMSIQIPLKNSNLSFFNVLVFLLYVYLFFTKKIRINFSKKNILFLLFCLLCLVTSLVSRNSLPAMWNWASWRASLKYIIIFATFVLLVDKELIINNRKYFFRGLYYAAITHLVWELLEILLFSVFNFHLNQFLFGHVLGIDIGRNWLFWSDGRMRPTGLSWEPANLGFMLILGYTLSNNLYFKVAFIIGAIFSTSRTAIGVLFFIIFLELVFKGFKYRKHINFKRILIYLVGGLIVFLVILLFLGEDSYLVQNINGTIDAFVNIRTQPSANRHLEYYVKLLDLLSNMNILQILFGLGVTCAGYGYAHFLGIYSTDYIWTPETDYISILIGNGVIGFLLYYTWILTIVKNNFRNFKFLLVLIAFLMMTTMAQFYRNWTTLILLFLAVDYSSTDYFEDINFITKNVDRFFKKLSLKPLKYFKYK